MTQYLKTWSGLFLTLLFFIAAIASTLLFTTGPSSGWLGRSLQEILCFCAIFNGVIWVLKQPCFERMGIMQKLRTVTGMILFFWGLMRIMIVSYPMEVYYDAQIFGKDLLWLALQVSMLAVVCFMMLCVLKSLIYVHPGRGTYRNFIIVVLLIFFTSVSAIIGAAALEDWEQDNSYLFNGNIVQSVLESCLLLSAFITGFRCKWMHYLNRRQKLMTTGAGIGLILLLFSMVRMLPGVSMNYSIIVSHFIKYSIIVIMIYGSMAMAGLILYLPSAGLIDRRMKDIRSLQQISTTIGTIYDRPELLKKASEQAMEILNAQFTWIELKKDDEYKLAASFGIGSRQIDELQNELKSLRSFVEDKNEVVLIHDLYRNRIFRQTPRHPFWGGSLLASLLIFKNEILGMMFVGKREIFGFVEENRGLFRALCNQVAVSLENARLVEISIEREVYKEELRVAHQAQMRLLPQRTPQYKELEVDGFCLTANDIGGDFYDYVQVSDHRLDVVIGDVSGKGAAAAFYMAELKGVIQALASHFQSPKAMLIQINNFLKTHMQTNMFVTMIYMMFDLKRKRVLFSRAGHEPLGYFHQNKITWIEKSGLGLGLVQESRFKKVLEEDTILLSSGDRFFLYTDGLIESRNENDEEFGLERLNRLLREISGKGINEISRSIRNEIERFCENASQQDDITTVMVRFKGDSENEKR